VIITPDGYILTNSHVVHNLRVGGILSDGKTYAADVVGEDSDTDLAVLRIPRLISRRAGMDKLRWALVIAIGNPYGFQAL
jgi:S1-C subfamily serine protease